MCGITGFVAGPKSEQKFIREDLLRIMSKTLNHRGPDDSGAWFESNLGVGLAHQRLSIIDTSIAGRQPMRSSTGRYRIIFNGEAYNHVEIRQEINSIRNVKWKSNSDTETLLEAFETWGITKSVKKIVGMFAIAVWDQHDKSLNLIRDRMGEKPLYYGWQNNVFLFGSEIKSLSAHPSFENNLSRKNIALYMRYSYVPDPHSIFENIYKLPPASILKLKLDSIEYKQQILPKPTYYWSLKDSFEQGKRQPIEDSREVKQGLKARLLESTKLQSRSDVPLGAFLSGGIDSSTIVALLQEQSMQPIKTYTIGFENNEYNEAIEAAQIAKILGTDHTEYYVNAEETMEVIPYITELYDEPFSDSSQIPTYIVSKLAASEVKVSLSGDAGDELFGGYNRYISAPRIFNNISRVPYSIRVKIAKSLEFLPISTWQITGKILGINQIVDKVKKSLEIMKSTDMNDVYSRLTSHWINDNEVVLNSISDYQVDTGWMEEETYYSDEEKMMFQDLSNYLLGDILVKVDRAAMGVSLETRVPFLDHRVVEYACRIPLHLKIKDNSGKWPLKDILSDYIPQDLIERPKMGFGVPIDDWLRGPLGDWAESLINEDRLNSEGIFNPKKVRKKWNDHINGKNNWQHHLWDLLIFQSWLDSYKSNIN